MMTKVRFPKRLTALILALALLLPVWALPATAEPDVFFACTDNTILALEQQYMPMYSSGVLYAPTRAISNGTGIAVTYTQRLDVLSLTKEGVTLVFDLAGQRAYDEDQIYPVTVVQSGSVYYVPVAFVTDYFGLTYSTPSTIYGSMLRLHVSSKASDDAAFISTNAARLATLYNTYMSSNPSPLPPVTGDDPSVSPSPPPSPPANVKVAYLSFDDGPHAGITDQILDVLDEFNVKATFFLLGSNLLSNPNAIRRMDATGHVVALHSYTHDHKKFYSSGEAMIAELEKTNDILEDITHTRARLLRVPYGSVPHMTPELCEAMSEGGYRFWDWNIDSGDTSKGCSTERIETETIQYLKNMAAAKEVAIVLFHEKEITLKALPKILRYMIEEGYEFRVITESEEANNFRKYTK